LEYIMLDHRHLKDTLNECWARLGKAIASPKRLELLDLLAQGEKTVEVLAGESDLTVTNASAHLAALHAARLIDRRKAAQFVHYRLADPEVLGLLRQLQRIGRRQFREVQEVARAYLDDRDALEPVEAAELRRRLRRGDVTVLDVRPAHEYKAGHIPGAVSVPPGTLQRRLADIPRYREVVAYCRGPYCVFSVDATESLRRRGYRARRLRDGFPDWRAAGYPVAAEPETPPVPAVRRPRRRA
jgi:rhodanese-related sulfurtransferase